MCGGDKAINQAQSLAGQPNVIWAAGPQKNRSVVSEEGESALRSRVVFGFSRSFVSNVFIQS